MLETMELEDCTPSHVQAIKMREFSKAGKGNIIGSDEGEHWLMLTVSYYNLRYVGVVNEFLKMLEETKDYHNIHKYAAQALVIEPGNMKAYYWLIFAMCQMGATEIAQSEFEMAKQHLTEEEYEELIDALKKMPIDTHRGHFQGLECR
ncbi:MAG: hypothetical protein J6A88_07780 [Oscillospiraceae bacterium]|nr:hypothetical protein [Oscillospiraceae bacterium]